MVVFTFSFADLVDSRYGGYMEEEYRDNRSPPRWKHDKYEEYEGIDDFDDRRMRSRSRSSERGRGNHDYRFKNDYDSRRYDPIDSHRH